MVEFFGHPVLDLEATNTSTKLRSYNSNVTEREVVLLL